MGKNNFPEGREHFPEGIFNLPYVHCHFPTKNRNNTTFTKHFIVVQRRVQGGIINVLRNI